MQLKADGIEFPFLQSVVNDAKRHHLFRDEEDTLSALHSTGNDVCNGLGFAGPGRTLDDKVLPRHHLLDRNRL